MIFKQHSQDVVLFFHPFIHYPHGKWSNPYEGPMYQQLSVNPEVYNLSIVNNDKIYFELATILSPLERLNKLINHVKGQRHELKEGDKLFFQHSCTFPQSLVADRFRVSKRSDDYDAVVIPVPEPIKYRTFVTVFRSMTRDRNVIIIFEELVQEDGKALASELASTCRSMRDEDLTLLKNAKCIHKGAVIGYSDYNNFVPNVINKTYKNVVTEHDLIHFLAGKDDEFTVDSVRQLYAMAVSPDIESRELCLRTLAAMDYVSYPFIVSKILSYIPIEEQCSSIKAVKYMYYELGRINPLRDRYTCPKEDYLIRELAEEKILTL